MKDKYKTKAQLIDELLDMRQRVSEMESSENERTRELAQSEARFRQMVENPLIGVWQADKKGRFVFVSKGFAEMSGYSQDEMIGKSVMVPIAPELRSWLEERMQKRSANKFPPEVLEAEMVRKDGSRFTALVAPASLYDDEERFNGFIGTMIDITERKKAEEALRESKAQKKAILDASVDRIRLIDLDMRIIWANKRTARGLNMAPEDLVGQPCYKIFFDRAAPCDGCPSEKALISGNIEHSIMHQPYSKGIEGETYWDSYSVPIKNESGDTVNLIQIARNITVNVRAEQELREREAELENKTNNLEDVNTALRVLLKRVDKDKEELEEKVVYNVKELVFPFLEKMKNGKLDPKQLAYTDMLESNLNGIISPFLRDLSAKYINLTPTETRVAYLIKEGKTTKEIAEIMALSPRTIETHRKNMRKKLDIEKKRGNLKAHLLNFQ